MGRIRFPVGHQPHLWSIPPAWQLQRAERSSAGGASGGGRGTPAGPVLPIIGVATPDAAERSTTRG
jgi:hypothetical protein